MQNYQLQAGTKRWRSVRAIRGEIHAVTGFLVF